ncbi:SUKH-4 family immunity protein [Streptomyces sp. NBC_00498]|uniref:SUKH-4 family immunity protein n=1 Tax=Streptomyces sp. NBC_00498 TaxID=2975760 RepID=UPI002E1823E3
MSGAAGDISVGAEGVPGRVGAWWRAGGRGGSAAYVVAPVGADTGGVMRRVHEDVPGSVLVDAAGLSAEQVVRGVLKSLGVEADSGKRGALRTALGALREERLVVLVNTRRAGVTRRSYEPERLITWALPWLTRGKVAVVTDTDPEFLPRGMSDDCVFRLPVGDVAIADAPAALRALALAEPRIVPFPVWAELIAGLSGDCQIELDEFAHEHADVLAIGPLGVSFVDENVAEELRRRTDPDELARTNRHLVDWLLQRAATDFRHPEGWARSNAIGLYAAAGLAMHAVQAGTYDELLRDGRAVAHLPQTALMDAARSRSLVVFGNTPAADAIHLWGWGVVPRGQGEWASWLHLMASSRGDNEFASTVAASGLALPWRTKWAHWRQPGGYHVRFLEAGRFVRLTEVRWQGRPAVAALQQRTVDGEPEPYVTVRDLESGELVAGPWNRDEALLEHRSELAMPDGSATTHPARLSELFADAAPPRDKDAFVLPCAPLAVGGVVVFGGDLGLVAIRAQGAGLADTFGSRHAPLTGSYADASPSSPVDAAPPSHTDLVALFGAEDVMEAEPEELPDELTHQPTRELLLEFGLPDLHEGAMALLPYGDGDVDPLDEVEWPEDVEAVAERGPFFQIGRWMGGELVVDGPTGRILRVPSGSDEEYLAGLPAARGLEEFLTMVALFVTGLRTRSLLPPLSPEREEIPYWVLGALSDVDEAGSEQPAWSYVLHNS